MLLSAKHKNIILSAITLLFVLILILAVVFPEKLVYQTVNKVKVEKIITEKENKLQEITSKYIDLLEKYKNDSIFIKSQDLIKDLQKNKLVILIYQNDSLIYWTDKNYTSEPDFKKTYYGNWPLKSYNAFVLSHLTETGNFKIVGFIPVKKIYPFENKYLKSSFIKEYKIPDNYKISLDEIEGGIFIKNKNGDFLFTLQKTKDEISETLTLFYFYIYLILIILILMWINRFFEKIIKKQSFIFLSLVFYLIFRYFLSYLEFPFFLYQTKLFSPLYYAQSAILPSLGDLIISSVFILHFAFLIYKKLNFENKKLKTGKISLILIQILFYNTVFYIMILYLIKSAVINSNIPLILYNPASLNFYTFLLVSLISFLVFAFILISKKFVVITVKFFNLKKSIIIYTVTAFILLILFDFLIFEFPVEAYLYFLIIIVLLIFAASKNKVDKQSVMLLVIFISAIFTGLFIINLNKEKELKIRKMYAIGKSSEHDFVAEMKFPKFEQQLATDTILQQLVLDPIKNTNIIYDYIIKNYFHGYWSKYEPVITICGTTADFVTENQLVNCNNYFNEKLMEYGVNLENTKFKFLDDLDGKISYLGALEYTLPDDSNQVTIFIEMHSKLKSEKLGYPKLLIASTGENNKLFVNSYSYAKYKNNKLVFQHGKYQYKLNCNCKSQKEFYIYNENNFSHLVYQNQNNAYIISFPEITFSDYLAVFSYLFVFFFLLYSIGSIFTNKKIRTQIISYNLKTKIQFSLIGILILSLVTIGAGTIYLNIKNTKKTYTDEIGEKIQSILVELQQKFGDYDKLTKQDIDYIKYLFEKWSYVFFTDINLYDTNGNLLTSSRMEVFENKLTGKKMDKDAFVRLKLMKNSEYIHNEKIGKLEYMSAYVPFMNQKNDILAYLNLPYFTKQNKITNENSKLFVALLNIYVLLFIISVFIAVLVAQNITKPLLIIQRHLGQINLLKNLKPISYNRKDEIGALVQEYNKVIAELERSANLLAHSERESAWREMAKQIAHEIKNPLTPMKLNVQYLLKAKENNDPEFDEKLKRITKSLIEQIDTLSKIANNFSNFANISKTDKEIIDLYEKLKNIVLLFEQTHNVKIEINKHTDKQIKIFADKEQITQVFNNLITNAIQAVDKNKQALIKIDVKETGNKSFLITVADNGNGIPENIQDKLFKPNFTTKSSGMGLGLAISKKIIESLNGKIYFRTEENKGTVFYVEIPEYNDN